MIKTMTKCSKNAKFTKRENSRLTKNIFCGFLNWILGHLQSSADHNKIVIGKISIRAIQKPSYCDQQTIVDGPNFNLTNGEIFFIFPSFFVHSIFAKSSPFFLRKTCFDFVTEQFLRTKNTKTISKTSYEKQCTIVCLENAKQIRAKNRKQCYESFFTMKITNK